MQKTTFLKKEQVLLNTKKWYLIDATNLILGKLAVFAANLLRGKNKVDYTPNVDCGDYLIIINSDHIKVSANKALKEKRYHHSGYIGGLKVKSLKEMIANQSDVLIYDAIRLMLPKNKLANQILKKLFIYKNDQHKHSAQNPTLIATIA